MNQVTLNIQKEYSCDVLICGGGVAGIAAAVSAAKSGVKVMLIENGGFLGGTATKGLVGPFMTCYDSKGEKQIIKGFFEELVQRLIEKGAAISHKECRGGDSHSGYRTPGHIGCTPFDSEALKYVAEEMCLEAGVELLYHTTVIGCNKEGSLIDKVYAADNNDIISIKAKQYVDTTGCAALAAKAGAEVTRENSDNTVQTASLFGIITGVDKQVLDKYMEKNTEMRSRFFMDIFENGQDDGSFPCGTSKLRIYEAPNGNWIVNMAQTDEQWNELDGKEVTDTEIAQRKQLLKILEFLRKNIPGLENIKLLYTASDIGIRESRRIVGKRTMTLEDMQNATRFEDRIAVCANSIDIHLKKGVSYSAHNTENYYIPLSCLISKNVDNLFAAGKCLSADRYAFAAVRVMPPSMAMGQAAGIAAATAVLDGVLAADVDYKKVQSELTKRGAVID